MAAQRLLSFQWPKCWKSLVCTSGVSGMLPESDNRPGESNGRGALWATENDRRRGKAWSQGACAETEAHRVRAAEKRRWRASRKARPAGRTRQRSRLASRLSNLPAPLRTPDARGSRAEVRRWATPPGRGPSLRGGSWLSHCPTER